MSRKTPIKYETPSDCYKRSFKSEEVARRKAEMENDGLTWSHYKCDSCNMWHIGHSGEDGEAQKEELQQ